MKNKQVNAARVWKQFEDDVVPQLRLSVIDRAVYSHLLRHSLATNMVRKGASLAEVSDVLRHRSRNSTMIYAKLDIDGLRSIAQPWPATGGVQ